MKDHPGSTCGNLGTVPEQLHMRSDGFFTSERGLISHRPAEVGEGPPPSPAGPDLFTSEDREGVVLLTHRFPPFPSPPFGNLPLPQPSWIPFFPHVREPFLCPSTVSGWHAAMSRLTADEGPVTGLGHFQFISAELGSARLLLHVPDLLSG